MNLFTAIETRRSSRRFTSQPIDEELLFDILQYASYAPSAGNARPWKFVVLCTAPVLQKATEIIPSAEASSKAPCGIVILGDLYKETQEGFWVQDCAACTNTLLLAAHGKGLGAVWTGIYPIKQRVEQFRELLDAPQSLVPFSMVLLGHTNHRPGETPERFNKSDVFFNAYGNKTLPR